MGGRQAMRMRWMLTALVAVFVWSVLAWEHLHGGVVTHHLLARGDLPGLSNVWGGVLLPVLAWFLLGRMQRRIGGATRGAGVPRSGRSSAPPPSSSLRTVVAGFVGAAVFGVLISLLFSAGREDLTSRLVTALPLLALLLPLYRAEYVLGFVMAMTVTFGAILPTAFAGAVALMAAVVYRGVRPLLLGSARWLARAGRRQARLSR